VIYRPSDRDSEVCLISTQGGKAWQLPKGLIEPGEEPEQAAKREVGEETGLHGDLVEPLEKIEYWYLWSEEGERVRIHKFVHFYLFLYTRGSTDDHDDEVVEARWFPIDEARKRLSFENERKVLDLAAKAIGAPGG
jgi:8-oxo-dGTP pyrophosphatase MutT (NUDIX family)